MRVAQTRTRFRRSPGSSSISTRRMAGGLPQLGPHRGREGSPHARLRTVADGNGSERESQTHDARSRGREVTWLPLDWLQSDRRRLRVDQSAIGDRVYDFLTAVCALVGPALVVAIAVAIFAAAWPAFARLGLSIVTTSDWDVRGGHFGAAPAVFGTLVSSAVALIIATPLAIGVAIFLSEFSPSWLRQPVGFLVDLLAAIPSVVYGLWGIFVLIPLLREYVMPFFRDTLHLGATPLFSGPAYGPSMLAAGLILAVMALPYISAVSREVLMAVPRSQREAALGLGTTRREMIRDAVIPFATAGIIVGI